MFFTGPCHCSYIFVTCLPLRVYVAGDLNKNIVCSKRSLGFATRAILGLIRLEPELPSAITQFLKYNSYQIESIFEATNCTDHWILIPIYGQFPFRE